MSARIPKGALTALITPFNENGSVNWFGFKALLRFQASQKVAGIVPVGTTGESPTLTEGEHEDVVSFVLRHELKGLFVLAGCGSNCTAEAMHYVGKVAAEGGKAVLLVDPYYNGPSSLELRSEYYGPIAEAFPDITIVPYIIPGRTGCKLLPEDLAILRGEYPNILAVKEATGDLENMARTRKLTSPEFQIFSGDDDKTFSMMTMPTIGACGVISVVSNIAPFEVERMCLAVIQGDVAQAEIIRDKLAPLFKIVTVLADREISDFWLPQGTVISDKFRNPLPIKTAMNGLGMPAGPCRQPLGKMSAAGTQKVRQALQTVWDSSPDVLMPVQEFFGVDIADRLKNDSLWAGLSY